MPELAGAADPRHFPVGEFLHPPVSGFTAWEGLCLGNELISVGLLILSNYSS